MKTWIHYSADTQDPIDLTKNLEDFTLIKLEEFKGEATSKVTKDVYILIIEFEDSKEKVFVGQLSKTRPAKFYAKYEIKR